MQEDSVRVKFDGEISGVDINTFTRVLLDYSTVVRESAQEIDQSARLSVEITGAEAGCLEAYLQLVPAIGKGLIDFAKAVAPELPDIIETASELYRLMKEISKGGGMESASLDGNTVKIIAHDGNVISVNQSTYNLYLGDGEAPTAVRRTFETLSNEKGISMISIGPRSEPNDTVSIPASEFEAMAKTPSASCERREGVLAKQTLTIVRAMFVNSKRRKWLFRWKGNEISAPITDDTFFERFPDLSFRLGDALVADLRVVQRLDNETKLYLNDSYEVVRVHSKVETPSTEQLDF